MKIVIIDNYDSFTYNLRQIITECGAEVDVLLNDTFEIGQIEEYDKIVFSPGPGLPSDAGQMEKVIATYAGRKPMLGICLGEQAIGEVFGAGLKNLRKVFHGIQTPVQKENEDYIFDGLQATFNVGRYHSWIVDEKDFPTTLSVTSRSPEGYIMSLKHNEFDIHGLQFHPESILTPEGWKMIANFINKGEKNEIL